MTTLEGVGLALLRCLMAGAVSKLVGELVEIQLGEEVIDGLGTHFSHKLVRIGILEVAVALGKLLLNGKILFLAEQVILLQPVGLVTGLGALRNAGNNIERTVLLINNHITWVDDNVTLIVDYRVQFLGGKSQQITYLVGQ